MAKLNENLLKSLMNDLQEADVVTKEILSWTGEIYSLSWKYPNRRSDTIEFTKQIEEFSGSSEEKYLNTLELVIDRLNFFLRVFVAYLESFPTESGKCHIPPNVSTPPFMSLGALIHETWNKTKSIYYTMLERAENGVRNEMFGKGDYHPEKGAVSNIKSNEGSQTSLTSLHRCENCQISTNIIKTLMGKLEDIFTKINETNESESKKILEQSEITKFKEKMGPDMSKTTQWAAMSHLAEAISSDLCALQDTLEKCFSEIISQKKTSKHQEIRMNKLEKEKRKLLKDLQNGKMNETTIINCKSELENSLSEKNEENKSLSEQLEELRTSSGTLKKENDELAGKLADISQDLETMREELDMKTNEVSIFKQKYKTEMTNRKHAQEQAQSARTNVESLEEQLVVVQRNTAVLTEDWEKERRQIVTELSNIRGKIEAIKDEKNTLAKIIKFLSMELSVNVTEKNNLIDEVKEIKQELTLLVKYPDLHGPVESELIGIPDVDMQSQMMANNIRIRLLEDENSTLEKTIEKLKTKSQESDISKSVSTSQN